MTQEDKDLLLKDLSARLPYGCRVFYEYVDELNGKTYGYSINLNTWCINELEANKAVIKPYLRPMSSMTEEEWDDCHKVGEMPHNIIDWFNKRHFDYRHLIEKGLALEAPEEMYEKE